MVVSDHSQICPIGESHQGLMENFLRRRIPADEPDLNWFNRHRNPSNPDPGGFDQTPSWTAPEIQMDDERILVLESS